MKVEASHEPLSHLIPWYANGTLPAEERALVEEHLKTCAACQRELRLLRNVSVAMTELAEETPEVDSSFAKILAVVDSSEGSQPSVRRPWASWFGILWNPTIPVARLVFAAQLVLIVGLSIYSFMPRQSVPGFHTLSGSEESTGGARLTINFAPNAKIEQVNQLLATVGGRIVSGPSASGIYVIELPVRAEKDAEVQAVIDKLRINDAIRFVERQP